MLVSGGKLIAIDNVNTDGVTINGDGVNYAISVNTDNIATNATVNAVSSTLNDDIQKIYSNFDDYYRKTETSGSAQLAEEFDSIKSSIKHYDVTSLTPDILYAGVSDASSIKTTYAISATSASDQLAFDGTYDAETNKVATVESVNKATKLVKPIVLEYKKQVDYTWDELHTAAPNVYVSIGSAIYDLAVLNENIMIFRQHTAARINSDEHSQIYVTELQLFKNLNWNTETITYTVSDPWADTGTGITVSTGRVSINIDDSTVKINENNQVYAVQETQNVIYNTTTWQEIKADKLLVLNAAINGYDTYSNVYQKTDTHITWIANVNDKLYFIKLTNTDVWTMDEIQLSSTYSAGYGLSLSNHEFSVDKSIIASKTELDKKQDDITHLIPTGASADNKLTTQEYVDSAVERLEARYLGSTSTGDPFATYAELTGAKTYYYQGQLTTPDINDITVVTNDETRLNTSGLPTTTRYRWSGNSWAFEYVINNTGFTTEQIAAINSTITKEKVDKYENYQNSIDQKQDKLTAGDNITITPNNVISSTGTSDHKVSVTEGSSPDYLRNILVSDAEEITLTTVDNQLRVGLNLTADSDPKLMTIAESQINDSTNDYGSWWGDTPPAWNDSGNCNIIQYRLKRISDSQGSLTVCRCALTGNWSDRLPIFRIGIFDSTQTLLGSSDYFVYDSTTSQFVGKLFNDTIAIAQGAITELSVSMHEETVGSLKIARNTRYIIELISCGLSFAGKTQTGTNVTSNYDYDYKLENNIMNTSNTMTWWTDLSVKHQADKVPFLSFGASSIRSVNV